ncbi:MAG: hypothetical protein UT26_C0025G0006 [Microgenomates group bacterium GW2011_GWC1_39_12]|nr:MAG: hypothetical protein UT26_C0025G0006 [Microgenomates group bacterium GW2011_GWC1_39_12]
MEKIDPLTKTKNIKNFSIDPEVSEEEKVTKQMKLIIGAVFILMIGLGIVTGFIISGKKPSTSLSSTASAGPTASGKNVFGSADSKTFTDSATGVVEKNGISGEGTHKLIRDGGPSQTACLVSSVLDLDQFVGKKVKVTSKTMDAKKCPWFMDVGRIEVLE